MQAVDAIPLPELKVMKEMRAVDELIKKLKTANAEYVATFEALMKRKAEIVTEMGKEVDVSSPEGLKAVNAKLNDVLDADAKALDATAEETIDVELEDVNLSFVRANWSTIVVPRLAQKGGREVIVLIADALTIPDEA